MPFDAQEALPRAGLDDRHVDLLERRQVGELRQPLLARHRDALELPLYDERQGRERAVEDHVALVGDHGADGRGAAAIGDMRPVDAALLLDDDRGQVLDRADAARADLELARVGLAVGEQLGETSQREWTGGWRTGRA